MLPQHRDWVIEEPADESRHQTHESEDESDNRVYEGHEQHGGNRSFDGAFSNGDAVWIDTGEENHRHIEKCRENRRDSFHLNTPCLPRR